MNSKLIFILGGIRSGKTSFAITLLTKQAKKKPITYIATGIATDLEMEQRIKEHKKFRPKSWNLVEEPINLIKSICKIKSHFIIIDCINFWVSNLLQKKITKEKILELTKNLLLSTKKKNIVMILVSNEVGLGLVSPYKSGRIFQDILGKVNKIISEYADNVYFMVSGLPLKLK